MVHHHCSERRPSDVRFLTSSSSVVSSPNKLQMANKVKNPFCRCCICLQDVTGWLIFLLYYCGIRNQAKTGIFDKNTLQQCIWKVMNGLLCRLIRCKLKGLNQRRRGGRSIVKLLCKCTVQSVRLILSYVRKAISWEGMMHVAVCIIGATMSQSHHALPPCFAACSIFKFRLD